MANRFSSRELFELRNNIPVDMLIRDHFVIAGDQGHHLCRQRTVPTCDILTCQGFSQV